VKKIILPVFLSLLFLAILFPRFFIKVRVECKSQSGGCPSSVTDQLSRQNGKSIFLAEREIKKNLKSNFLVSAFTLQFKLPNILRVDLIIKKPVFALKSVSSEAFDLVDADGYVLETSGETSLPKVIKNENIPGVGEKVSDKDFLALQLTDGAYKMYQISSSTIEGDTLLVDLVGPIRVLFPLVGADRELLLGSLRLIYSNIQNREGGVLYSQIDLRYKNPVLR
jgi:hypothetical protein